jgi:serine/threonine protein kinase/tetratricopeptide (TPR) repeat protein
MGDTSPKGNETLQTLGKYTLIEKLGDDYLGPVYRGFDQGLGRPVVIRILCEGIKWDAAIEELFFSQCRSIAALEHPNIASVFEVGKEGQNPFIVIESLGGINIEALIAQKSPMSAESKLSIMVQAVEGLGYAHSKGILHGDLTPAKIHLPPDGGVKVRDFAITHILMQYLSRPIVRWGAPIYLSPEQIQQKECDERSDIFSAGMIFYELLTYFHPFHDPNGNKALDNILKEISIPTFERFPDVPPGLWAILKTCLARNPAERYQNMGELLEACKDLQKSLEEDTGLMLAELYSAMTPLKKAAAHPDASESIVKLFRDIQALQGGGAETDYVTLDRLMTTLIEKYPAIQAAAEASDSMDPHFFPDEIRTELSGETEQAAAETFDEMADLPGLLPDADSALQEEYEAAPETEALKTENWISQPPQPLLAAETSTYDGELQQSSIIPDAGPQNQAEPAAGFYEDPKLLPDAGTEANRRTSLWPSRYRGFLRPSYRNAAVLLSILIIAAAGYIVFGTESHTPIRNMWNLLMMSSPMEVSASVPEPGSGIAGDASAIANGSEGPSVASETDAAGEPVPADLNGMEAEESAKSSEATTSRPTQKQLGRISALIESGKLRLAGVELKKLQQIHPKASSIAALHRRLQAENSRRAEALAGEEKNRKAAEKEKEWSLRAQELFARGKYNDAGGTLNLWLEENPRSPEAKDFRAKLEEVRRSLRIYASAISENRYRDALGALQSVERINPADPNIAEWRRQAEARMASARAVLTVHRLGPRAMLYLDGKPIGNDGEILNTHIPIGNHTVSISYNGSLIASRTQEYFEDGQVVLVYDLSERSLRPFTEGDRKLLAQRTAMEEVHRFELEHKHGLFRGSCRGVLSVSYSDVAYKPYSGDHGFRIPFKLLRISKVEGKSIEFSYVSDNKRFQSFEFPDERSAQKFIRIWGNLKALPQ